MKHSAPRRRAKAAPADPIRASINAAILEVQAAWQAELETPRPNWLKMLSLHLQLAELEHLTGALAEFA